MGRRPTHGRVRRERPVAHRDSRRARPANPVRVRPQSVPVVVPTGRLKFSGVHADFVADQTREICAEGGLNSGKTIAALTRQVLRLKHEPGISTFIARWTSEATNDKLRPDFEKVCRLEGMGEWEFDEKRKVYQFPNGSRTFAFGLKTTSSDPEQRYEKIRGLPVSDIYLDQPESVPADIAEELRLRLRPDIEATTSGRNYPQRIVFTPNPVPKNHWLATQFPEDNSIPGRKLYSISLLDNAHNLPKETIEAALLTYPPEHPMHRIKILGKRGVTISGQSIYGAMFSRDLHLRTTEINPHVPLLEVLDFGKANPCVLWSQFDQWGRWIWHGGIMGEGVPLGTFCDILTVQRANWFPKLAQLFQACNPAGMTAVQSDLTATPVEVLRQHGIYPRVVANSNQPIIRRAAIDRITEYLQRRTIKGEAFQCDPDRWLIVSPSDNREEAFGPEAMQFGYVWDAIGAKLKTKRSANKPITIPQEDGWYEHVMTCAELTELNFGRGQQTDAQIKRAAERAERQALRKAQRDDDPFVWSRAQLRSRGGY